MRTGYFMINIKGTEHVYSIEEHNLNLDSYFV